MDCLSPIFIKKVKANESGFTYTPVPCGRCEACVRRRQEHWFTRLKFEQLHQDYCCFVTLTYDEANLPDGSNVCKEDLQLFNKRLRSRLDLPIKYYIVSEYGPETKRPHYHAIYFGVAPQDWPKFEESWQKGFVTVDAVTDGRLRYVTGYIIEKLFVPDGREPIFNLISKGLGASYIDEFSSWHNADEGREYVPYHGQKLALPRYFKEKIYDEEYRRKYARRLERKAEDEFNRKVERYGLAEVARSNYSDRIEFIRKVRKIHKKKKTLQ